MVVIVRQYHCGGPTGKGKEKSASESVGRTYLANWVCTNGEDGDINTETILKREALVDMYETNVKFPPASS